MQPEVLIMDEPFAALDAINRRHLQYELRQIWQATGRTIVFVTHDITEALILATNIAVLTPGPEATIKETFRSVLPVDAKPGDAAFVAAHRRIESLIEANGKG